MGDIWFKIDKDASQAERISMVIRNIYVSTSLFAIIFAVIFYIYSGKGFWFALASINFFLGVFWLLPFILRLIQSFLTWKATR